MKFKNNIKVLVIESQSMVALDIIRTLKQMGLNIIANARKPDEALDIIKNNDVDLILLDKNLNEKKDGIQTAKEINKIKKIPIIFITTDSDEDTIDEVINCDPVGCLVKPFKKTELKYTIKIVLKNLFKTNGNSTQCLQYLYENISYDCITQTLYSDNEPIKLSANEKAFLSLLLSSKGKLLTFSEIENYVWPDKVVSNSTTRSLIHRFRTKTNPKLIETVPGLGCKLNQSH